MRCPLCDAENDAVAVACFTCGRAFDALTQGHILSGRYEVRRHLGSGGMGRVYEAFDRVLEEPVAIKVLRAEFTGDEEVARRFLHEIKLSRRISHSRVCRIHEYGEADGLAYISMEYISGRSLKQHLAARRPTLSEGYDLALQIGDGLSAIHHHGVVHRDLKSANIMVDAQGGVKILDFGIAKQTDGASAGLTAGDRIFGTPEYMSPEQVEGGGADARSDIYALGCVVFEIFTGRPPFQGETPYATLLKHLKEAPPLDPAVLGLPAPLLQVLSRALAKVPNDRFRTAEKFIAALRAAREAGPVADGATSPGTIPNPYPTSLPGAPDTVTMFRGAPLGTPRRRWAWGAVAVVAAALGLVVMARLGGSPAPDVATPAPAVRVTSPPSTLAASALDTPATAVPSRSTTPSRPLGVAGSSAPTSSPTVAPAAPPTTAPALAPMGDPPPGVTEATTPPATQPAAPSRGTLALMIVPDAEVVLDGASIGVVGQRDVVLAAGAHQLEVLHPDYQPLPRRFTIRAAETLTLILDLQEKGIRKVVKPSK